MRPGPFEFERAEVVPGRLHPKAFYAFDGVQAFDATFDLSHVGFTVQRSEFDRCQFTQSRKLPSDGVWGQGSLARYETTYRDCVFQGVRLYLRAGFSVGAARFERCSFVRCDFGEHFSFCADYVDCTFVGPIRVAVFYGAAPDRDATCGGKQNQIRGNDFTAATLKDVSFRGHPDLSLQRWPDGTDPSTLISSLSGAL